ncbi:membrane-associated phospholipid phosphatase [Caulobacter sp. AP07]|uniref:phosphatase PAP2 family protein n=1 Tax=Caulobacter sp. AP07 TaxID=1144304 RepID=UPI00027210F7|nr:phosphatase PAP2 family protein [Caulobacter sp. AP07]EJL34797.1 membrane-associated phospholipid phosphatase [Caulobacter sp. AP07]
MRRLSDLQPRRDWARLLAAARGELGVLAALLVLAGGALAFLDLSEAVAEGDTKAFDMAVLRALRLPGDPSGLVGPPWLHVAAADVTALGSVTVLGLVVVLAVALMLCLRRWSEAVVVLVGAVGGVAISQALKHLFLRERPEMVYRAVEAANPSFPSGHAMLSAVVFLTLGALAARFSPRRRVKALALGAAVLLSLLVGASRVYLGVHWASDVLAGWSVGAAWAMACWLAAWAWGRWGGPVRPQDTVHPDECRDPS